MSGNLVGIGYDIHRLVEGRKLVLAGVEIPFEKGLLGHSDADVLTHAVCDALLGAAGMGDIGHHFPDTDERYRGIESLKLLAEVVNLLDKRSLRVQNVDATVIIERPKLAPYILAIRENLASVLSVDAGVVNIKAKSNEGLGDIGNSDAAVAQAICSLFQTVKE
jgi:2-C-methyl-D-erythritol 2,4-cyclodiphosphate synthase